MRAIPVITDWHLRLHAMEKHQLSAAKVYPNSTDFEGLVLCLFYAYSDSFSVCLVLYNKNFLL